MNLGQRLLYYLGGFGIGLILLFFFLGGKNTSCDYGPSARVLKNIRIKERAYAEEALQSLKKYNLDTSNVSSILLNGSVNFSKSNTDLDSCNLYSIEGKSKKIAIELTVENCDSIAVIQKITSINY
ncbi:DUF4258 domain-containing protein [Aquimarina brevivitae]|uniref:DUF4258 domain-containing protein n=1 Tax=Aquimarina brevivitae TaxID=323412 RepID=A0A4Q7P1I0_9FLAO|nr:DUF4258 domain-containing protein [Aquimarina brevivitae]RZS93706.1 hypothetical protein EV197_2286 [Aquimarina brevivitae]